MVAYHVGFNLIDPSSAANSNGGKSAKEKIDQRRGETAAASIEWFLWATELIEGGELQSSKELQVSNQLDSGTGLGCVNELILLLDFDITISGASLPRLSSTAVGLEKGRRGNKRAYCTFSP